MFRILLALMMCGFVLASKAQDSITLVKRNTKAPVEANGVIIRQDNRNVGYVHFIEPYNSGEPTRICQVFVASGKQVANAFAYGKNSHDWLITITGHPDITIEVSAKAGTDALEIAKAVIAKGYL